VIKNKKKKEKFIDRQLTGGTQRLPQRDIAAPMEEKNDLFPGRCGHHQASGWLAG
jgi:hypothetical protein